MDFINAEIINGIGKGSIETKNPINVKILSSGQLGSADTCL